MNREQWALELAQVVAKMSKCQKRSVGAVVFDRDWQVVSTGFNGPPSGQPHCDELPCKAMTMAAPMSHLACRAVHSEANALLRAGRLAKDGILCITTSPCYACAALIVNAKIKTVIVGSVNRLFTEPVEAYSQSPKDLLASAGIIIKELS